MSEAAGKLFSIPAGLSFVDSLAAGLLRRYGGGPLGLAEVTVLLPTRRACRSLLEAFLEAAEGRALLLPRLLPLGDLDAEELAFLEAPAEPGSAEALALPPAMPELRRRLLLTRLIQRWQEARPGALPGGADQAARLAESLARLVDQVETEGLDWSGLRDLVPADYADHWQQTLAFLEIVTESWPAVEAEEGAIGPAARRRSLLERQAAAWRRAPPAGPVVVAGSTGSLPATAALIATVAALPEGLVVLPGLDRSLDEETWSAVEADPSHPQHGLARLLRRLEATRAAVLDWPEAAAPAALARRADLLNEALRPAAAPAPPRDPDEAASPAEAEALTGLRRIDCASPAQEALVIAMILRQSLEVPGRRAALVTPDRALARRVAAELRRWSIEIDDSAGQPLAMTPPGAFLRLTAEMLAAELAPLPLLAALKHPLAAGGEAPGAFRAKVRALEIAVLRGPRPAPGFAGLRAALEGHDSAEALRDWLNGIEAMAAPFLEALAARPCRLPDLAAGHVAFAEALAASDEARGAARLWAQEAGEAAALFAAELMAAADPALRLGGADYAALLESLMAGRAVRPHGSRHPRLAILGPLEARLSQPEVVVLGGLNEATWPAETDSGPWLSRPMRAAFGLPPPERRIGLSAHDFLQAACAPRVYLTRATRVEGTPSVPSRWLLRLDALLKARKLADALLRDAPAWRHWAEALDRPAQVLPAEPPEPRPPVKERPRELSATEITTLIHDPYALYAQRILALRPLEPLDADPGAAERGILIHEVLERFVRAHPEALPADPLGVLMALGEAAFRALRARPGQRAYWWPRFERIARWFVDFETERRRGLKRSWAELRGATSIKAPAGPVELRARADRVDLTEGGKLEIFDYKTGQVPPTSQVVAGFAPQLPLEAAIAAAGGFPELPAGTPEALFYLRLTGGSPAGELRQIRADGAELVEEVLDGLTRLLAHYDDPAAEYWAAAGSASMGYDPYGHLARRQEWSVGGGAEEGG